MGLLQRNQLPPTPTLQKQSVQVDALGGEVVVCGLLLSQRLALHATNARLCEPQPGEPEETARARAGAALIAQTLAQCVVLGDGLPLYSVDEWEAFGASHPVAALDLFAVARRLNGMDAEGIEKN